MPWVIGVKYIVNYLIDFRDDPEFIYIRYPAAQKILELALYIRLMNLLH